MTLRLVTAATSYGVTLEDAKAHLRVDHDDDNALIEALIPAAYAHAEKMTGQIFASQTWEQVVDEFPDSAIGLDIGPVASITSVKYIDADGVEQTIAAEDYTVDTVSSVGRVLPVDTWPAAIDRINAVVVRFVVGGGTPPDVRAAILLIIGLWYDTRATATTESMSVVPMGAKAILEFHLRYHI